MFQLMLHSSFRGSYLHTFGIFHFKQEHNTDYSHLPKFVGNALHLRQDSFASWLSSDRVYSAQYTKGPHQSRCASVIRHHFLNMHLCSPDSHHISMCPSSRAYRFTNVAVPTQSGMSSLHTFHSLCMELAVFTLPTSNISSHSYSSSMFCSI